MSGDLCVIELESHRPEQSETQFRHLVSIFAGMKNWIAENLQIQR